MTEKDKMIQDQAMRIKELEAEVENLTKAIDKLYGICLSVRETPETPLKAWKLMREAYESATD